MLTATPTFVQAYTDRLSYQAGDEVLLHVSTNADRYTLAVERDGREAEEVLQRDGLTGVLQPIPQDASSRGCGWQATDRFSVPGHWRSGYYRIKMWANDRGGQAHGGEAFFVVRNSDPKTRARILLPLATNTYNAYNAWGGLRGPFAGSCLYDGVRGRSNYVSFHRPLEFFLPGDSLAKRNSGWHRWERSFVLWAEQNGYALDFAVNSDLESPQTLEGYRLVLSVGHDEYWSLKMKQNLETFVHRGGNAAFFSGNTCFWKVAFEGASPHVMKCFRFEWDQDPSFAAGDFENATGLWHNRPFREAGLTPENHLTGVSFCYGGYHNFHGKPGDGSYKVWHPGHWVFAQAGVGDTLGGPDVPIVGYECDGCDFGIEDGLPVPTHEDDTPDRFVILGTAVAYLDNQYDRSYLDVSEGLRGERGTAWRVAQPGHAVMGLYDTDEGGTVFTTGCTEWVRGLERGHGPVERITKNVLDKLGS